MKSRKKNSGICGEFGGGGGSNCTTEDGKRIHLEGVKTKLKTFQMLHTTTKRVVNRKKQKTPQRGKGEERSKGRLYTDNWNEGDGTTTVKRRTGEIIEGP